MCGSICSEGPGPAEGDFSWDPLSIQSPNRTIVIHSLEKTGPTDHLKGQGAHKSSVTPCTWAAWFQRDSQETTLEGRGLYQNSRAPAVCGSFSRIMAIWFGCKTLVKSRCHWA